MRPSEHGLAGPLAAAVEAKGSTKHRIMVANDRVAVPCRRAGETRRTQSSMTLGCLCALLRPRRGSAWGGHVVAEGWRHLGGPFAALRKQHQKQLDASSWGSFDVKNRRGTGGGPSRRGKRRPRVFLSVIAASGSSGGNSRGSIDAAAASSPCSPFTEGEDAAPPFPPLTSAGGNLNDDAVNSDTTNAPPARSRRSHNINNGNAQKRVRRRDAPQQQQSESEGVEDRETKEISLSISELEQEMRRLGKEGRWKEALEVLGSVAGPTQREYVAAIAACDFAGQPRQALRVHALMVEQGLKPNPESVLLVVRGLLYQAGDAPTALRMFQSSGVRIRGRRYTPGQTRADSALTMNALYAVVIRAAQKAGDWREAVLLYREVEALTPGPSAATAATVFLACYAEREYAAAVSFAAAALRPPWEEVKRRRVLTNKIIVACGRAGPDHYRQALDTFEDLDRTIGADGYTLTAVIDVLRRLGDWRRALPLLERLTGLGVSADRGLRTSVNAVLSAMGPDNYRRARELEAKATVEWGVDGDVVTYGTLLLLASARWPPPSPLVASGAGGTSPVVAGSLTMAGGDDRVARGKETEEEEDEGWETVDVLRRALAAKAVPSEACLDMVVFGLARNGLWVEASAFVDAMEQAGLKVSRHQREALLSALSNGGRWRDVLAMVESMLANSDVVDNPTAGLAMKAYANLGLREHWRSASSLMKQAQRASRASGRVVEDLLDGSAWRCLLADLAGEGLHEEAGLVMQAMAEAGVRVDKDSTAAVVVAADKAGDHAAAVAWVHRLHRAGLPVSRNGYAAAVKACCALGQPEVAMDVLGLMSEARIVPTASVFNAVLETICPPSEGGYSARVPVRDADQVLLGGRHPEATENYLASGLGLGGGGGGEGELNGLVRADGGRRRGQGEKEPPELGRDPRATVKADRALSLFEVMWEREMPMNGVTYAMVICALLRAEREDEVLRLWTLAWGDPSTEKFRRDMANRVLGICKAQRRGGFAVRLLQLGGRLAPKGDAWPGPGPYWAAMEACEREGATSWRYALALVDDRDAGPLPADGLFSEAAASLLQKAVALGMADAVEAASTRVWQKPDKNTAGGGGGRRVGGVRAAAAMAAMAAAATAAVDQRAEATNVD